MTSAYTQHIHTIISHPVHILRSVGVWLLLLLLTCANSIEAQTVSASTDREKILIGEQVTLQLKADNITESTTALATWFIVPDTIPGIVNVRKEGIDTIAVSGKLGYTQKIVITSFDSGKWIIPALEITILDKAAGKRTTLKTNPLALEVLPVDVSAMTDYHPMKEIIDVDVPTDWWMVGAVAASAIILFLAVYFIVKRKKTGKPAPRVIPPKGTPLERALQQLQHLQEVDLSDKKQVKGFHSTIDTVCRTYLQESFHINALHITAGEILLRMNVYLQNDNLKQQFAELIRLNTAVKFARFFPDAEQSRQTLMNAIESLRQLDTMAQQTRNNAN